MGTLSNRLAPAKPEQLMGKKVRPVYPLVVSMVAILFCVGVASGQTQIRGTVGPFQNMCFDAWMGRADDGTQIALHPCHGGGNQQWTVVNGAICGTVAPFQGMCFDAWQAHTDNGTRIRLHPCHGGANQQWGFVNGTIRGTLAPFQNKCFDAWMGRADDGTPIALQTCHGGGNQQWVLEPIVNLDAGVCYDLNAYTGKVNIFGVIQNLGQEFDLTNRPINYAIGGAVQPSSYSSEQRGVLNDTRRLKHGEMLVTPLFYDVAFRPDYRYANFEFVFSLAGDSKPNHRHLEFPRGLTGADLQSLANSYRCPRAGTN